MLKTWIGDVPEHTPQTAIAVAGAVGLLLLSYYAYSHPGYFSNWTYLGGLLLLELLLASIWLYRKVFFPLLIVSFMLAGTQVPFSSVWTQARWGILAVGASVGTLIVLKERRYRFTTFHLFALLAVMAALASAAGSRYTTLSSLKVLSLFLLFLYTSTGARLAVTGRENRFFAGLLIGCEIFVGIIAACYALGFEIMGNPNSLGAVMGIAAGPILLWGALASPEAFARRRRMAFFLLALYLTYASHARAAILAIMISCAALCLVLRRYNVLAQGLVLIFIVAATMAIVSPEAFSVAISDMTSSTVYKGKDPAQGIMSSRISPWQNSVSVIQKHLWFGTGFGTTDNGQDASLRLGNFSTSTVTSIEHGSSYLAITSWVGLAGLTPFILMVGLLISKIIQTLRWVFRTGESCHAAVPLALVALAGLIHAGFEDWLFAPGYYLCVFFWSLASILIDQAPAIDQRT